MLVLEILAGTLGLGAAVAGVAVLNGHSTARFGHRFLAWGPLLLGAAAIWAFVIGAGLAQQPTLAVPGFALAAAAVLGALALCVRNIRRTNLAFGLAGSAAQAALSVAVAVSAPLLLFVWAAFALLRGSAGVGGGASAAEPYTHFASSGPYHGDGSRHVFQPSIRLD